MPSMLFLDSLGIQEVTILDAGIRSDTMRQAAYLMGTSRKVGFRNLIFVFKSSPTTIAIYESRTTTETITRNFGKGLHHPVLYLARNDLSILDTLCLRDGGITDVRYDEPTKTLTVTSDSIYSYSIRNSKGI